MKIIIPARAGSKRILNKNIVTQEVYVSTDSSKIKKIAKMYGAKHIQRPPELATDISSTNSVIRHFLEVVDGVDHFACVQATSPLVAAESLAVAFRKIKKRLYNSVISVCEKREFYWSKEGRALNFDINKKPRTQDLQPWFLENGAFYVTTKKNFLPSNNLVNGNVGLVVMPKLDSIDIDDRSDLQLVEYILQARSK